MAKIRFIRLAEVINKKEKKRVVSISVIPTVTDCSGTVWFTDLQLQEGEALSGFILHTEKCLLKYRENGSVKAPLWFNGIVRTKETVIICNQGETSAPLDIHIYPKSAMAGGKIRLSQGAGGQKVIFPGTLNAEDDLALLASTRECKRNGAEERKEGFYQYSAAWDSKHNIQLEDKKSARFLFILQQMQDGGEKL